MTTVFSINFLILCGGVLILVYLSISALVHRVHVTGLENFPDSILDWFAIIAVAGFSFLIVIANIGISRLLKKAGKDNSES